MNVNGMSVNSTVMAGASATSYPEMPISTIQPALDTFNAVLAPYGAVVVATGDTTSGNIVNIIIQTLPQYQAAQITAEQIVTLT